MKERNRKEIAFAEISIMVLQSLSRVILKIVEFAYSLVR